MFYFRPTPAPKVAHRAVGNNFQNEDPSLFLSTPQNPHTDHNQQLKTKPFQGTRRRRFGADLTNTSRRSNAQPPESPAQPTLQSKSKFNVTHTTPSDPVKQPMKIFADDKRITTGCSGSAHGVLLDNDGDVMMTHPNFKNEKKEGQKDEMLLSPELGPSGKDDEWRPSLPNEEVELQLNYAFDVIGKYRRPVIVNEHSIFHSMSENDEDVISEVSKDENSVLKRGAIVNDYISLSMNKASESDTDEDTFLRQLLDKHCDIPYAEDEDVELGQKLQLLEYKTNVVK